jgi:nucleoid-associated protein EbfC
MIKGLGDLMNLGNLGEMMKQAQAMQQRVQELQAELERAEIEGASGGGLLRVVMNGKGDLRRVTIDPSLVKPEEAEVLADLLVAAHADAKAKVEARREEKMAELTGGLKLPGGFKLPFT